MIEARQCIRPQSVGEQMVPANAVIQNSQISGAWIGLQALRKNVGPTVIAVGGGAVAIGDGVSQNDDCACSGRGFYVNSGDEVPVINSFCDVELRRGDWISVGDIGGCPRTRMARLLDWSCVEAQRDGNIRQRICRKRNRIREVVCMGRNGYVGRAREG